MNNNIYIYNNLLNDKINRIIELGTKRNFTTKCKDCQTENFQFKYKYKTIKITDLDIHNLNIHNFINYDLYCEIMKCVLQEHKINYNLFNTNELNIIDGLYEQGSNKIYIEHKKNIFNSKKNKFSEHYGLLYFKANKLDKVVVQIKNRVEKNDPDIYMPVNDEEAYEVNYVFHTHPKTPYLGSRIKISIVYEFPSLSDILHFVEHHNRGMMLGSIVIAPEGIYNIRKNIFSRDRIKLDYDIFLSEMEEIYISCFETSASQYKDINIKKIENEYKIPEEEFYTRVSTNVNFIKKINYALEKYDLTIDFYNRIYLNNKWIFPTIYLPEI
jgi:hypothetical protein